MSKNRMVNTRFWSDGFIVDKCNALDRLLFLYLLTNERTNIIGIYELSVRTAAFETGIDKDDLLKMLVRLSPKVEYFDGWVYIKRFVEHQQSNPSVDVGMVREVRALPEYVRDQVKTIGIVSYRLAAAFDTVSQENDRLYTDSGQTVPRVSVTKLKPKLNLTKPSKLHTAKKSPGKPKAVQKEVISVEETEIGVLYYEVIKSLKLPVSNHTTIKAKIKAMGKEDDPQKIINYLKFMRDQYESLTFDYKPQVSTALDIYTKRIQIRNSMQQQVTESQTPKVWRAGK